MSLTNVNKTNLQSFYSVIYGYMQNNYYPEWEHSNGTSLWWLNETEENTLLHNARLFYSYCTPFVIVIGILGNILSLCVFMTKNLRSLSASTYLSVLSVSDLLTLLFYVTVEWLRRGLVYLDPEMRNKILFFDENVVCQFQQYMAYVSRLLSAWIVVAFTLERYIGVCWPLLRKIICTKRGTKRVIGGIITSSTIVVLYKPILSAIYVSAKGNRYCTTAENYSFLSFILDSIYAILMSMIPFLVIVVLNILTIRKLLSRNKNRKNHNNIVTEESVIRLEFTIILLVVSFCFIAFNVPFFVVWLRTFLHSKHLSNTEDLTTYADPDFDYWQGILYITRTIFNMNYCINFFLYIIAGAYFRREVRMLFSRHSFRDLPYSLCSLRLNSNTRTPKTYL